MIDDDQQNPITAPGVAASGNGPVPAMPVETPPPAVPRYRVGKVLTALLVAYALAAMGTARNLARWAERLPDSPAVSSLRQATHAFWQACAALGADAPELVLESWFLARQGRAKPGQSESTAEVTGAKAGGIAPVESLPTLKGGPITASKPSSSNAIAARGSAAQGALPAVRGPRVLILGDSIMMTVGPMIQKDVEVRLGGAAIVKAKLATGLARPDVIDWMKELSLATQGRHFDFIVVMLGTNDSQDFTESGHILSYGSKAWVDAYTRRLSAFMADTCKASTQGLWLALPPMRSPAFNRKAARLNTWARTEAGKHGCMRFVELSDVIGDPKGRFSSYLKIGERQEKVRTVDGIHVTGRGGAVISDSLMHLMSRSATVAH